MRTHEHFPVLWPAYDETFVREMLRVENLVAVRLEPVYSIRFEAFLDAIFERAGSWLVVPMIRIEGVSIMVPENPALGWPVTYETFAGEATDAIEAEVTPWLRSVTAGRLVNEEHVRFFRETPEMVDAYERARRDCLLGATPYADLLRSIGGGVYALRFASTGRVGVRGNAAANIGAALSTRSGAIDVEADAFSRAWFAGLQFGEIGASATYDCYVGPREGAPAAGFAVFDGDVAEGERAVSLAEPIPTDVTLSFDLEDAPEARRFAVTERALTLRQLPFGDPPVGGGSSGCIRLVVRDDAERFPDADTDAAAVLAHRLSSEGFDAAVTLAGKVDIGRTDLIHVFGLRHGTGMLELLRDAERANVPVIVTPYADDRRDEAVSGASGSLLIPRVSSDTIVFYDYVSAFARRKVANLTESPWYDEVSAVLMKRACAAIVAGPAEGAFLRERFAFSGSTVPSGPLVPVVEPQPRIGSLVGGEEFVLMHAPIEARNGQVYAALAAARLKVPLVFLGPVADIEFFRYVNEWSGPTVIQLRDRELSEGEIAGIYARARVVADISWSSRGLERVARGACLGASVVVPHNGYGQDLFGSLVDVADPASLDSVTEAFASAWARPPEDRLALRRAAAAAADPLSSLVAAASAYQQASAQPAR